MQWDHESTSEAGISVRQWTVQSGERTVPGVLWTRADQVGRRPLVLLGHGGSQHKTAPNLNAAVRLYVLAHGYAVAAIDGPIHGARRASPLGGLEMQQEFLRMWSEDNRVDAMIQDWRTSIDALASLEQIDASAIGWQGVSMGTAYGLPLAAAEPRLRCAVLGMWGTSYPNSERLADEAAKVRCPVLFLQKWNDQLFTRESQIALFDKLGSERKWLKVSMGPHAFDDEQLQDAGAFIVQHLES